MTKYITMIDSDEKYLVIAKEYSEDAKVFNNFDDLVIITPDAFQVVKDMDTMRMKYMDHAQFDTYEFDSENDDLVREVSASFINGLIAHRTIEDLVNEMAHIIDAAESDPKEWF